MNKAYVSMAIVSLVLGIMLSIQYRSNFTNANSLSPDQWAELTIQTEHLRNQHDALINERVALRNKLASTGIEAQSMVLQELLNKADIAAGLTPVTGPGIIIELNNKPNSIAPGNEYSFVLQDWNLLMLINELKSSGADAISINGERMVATSEVSLAGAKIRVNNNPINAPYKILAIGNPVTLESALRIKGGEADALLSSGIEVVIRKVDNMEIPAFRGSIPYQYARANRS